MINKMYTAENGFYPTLSVKTLHWKNISFEYNINEISLFFFNGGKFILSFQYVLKIL